MIMHVRGRDPNIRGSIKVGWEKNDGAKRKKRY